MASFNDELWKVIERPPMESFKEFAERELFGFTMKSEQWEDKMMFLKKAMARTLEILERYRTYEIYRLIVNMVEAGDYWTGTIVPLGDIDTYDMVTSSLAFTLKVEGDGWEEVSYVFEICKPFHSKLYPIRY